MDAPLESAADEVTRLRDCLNDLVSIMVLPAVWTGGERPHAVSNLLDALLGTRQGTGRTGRGTNKRARSHE